MLFMSTEHVDAMNTLLHASPEVAAACAELPVPRTLSYDLADGPDGETVHWTMTFDRTVRFSLDRPEAPDLLYTGDWAQMVRASAANRRGEAADPGGIMSGDESVLSQIAPAMEVARTVATLPVDFPEV